MSAAGEMVRANLFGVTGIAGGASMARIPDREFAARVEMLVASSFNLDIAELRSKSHKRRIARPRFFVFALLYFGDCASFSAIGRLTGYDHTSVRHGVLAACRAIATRPGAQNLILDILGALYAEGWPMGDVLSAMIALNAQEEARARAKK